MSTSGTPIAEYVYLQAQPLAMLRGGAIYYYHNDQLGTPKALTDQDQRRVWRADYTPFGDTIISVNEVENPLRFPGQYFDQETGLHYNYFRDYDPSIGRYTQSDPIGLSGGINTYLYVNGNPLRLSDARGLIPFPASQMTTRVRTTFADGTIKTEKLLRRKSPVDPLRQIKPLPQSPFDELGPLFDPEPRPIPEIDFDKEPDVGQLCP